LAKQLRLDVAQLTDVGRKREHNEDNMAYHVPPDVDVMARKGALFIVADGMGGHAAGEVASEIAVDTVSDAYYQDDVDDVSASLVRAIKRANASIHQRAAENMLRSGMGTTCVAAVLRGDMAYIANVGDSRAYLIRGGNVRQVSQDHSWVAEQVRAGLLTEDQARTHAQRNVITRCLGTQADVEIDVFTERLKEGDTLVLCSDGLSGLISDEDMRRIVSQFVPQESVYHLVERANDNGGPDNITAIVVHVQEVGSESNGRRPAYIGGRDIEMIGSEDVRVSGGLTTVPLSLAPQASDVVAPLAGARGAGTRGVASGPLISPSASPSASDSDPAESDTAPHPVVGTRFIASAGWGHGRLFYTTLALLVLLLMGTVGTGAYYVVGVQPFQPIRTLIMQAQGEVKSHPSLALEHLASAQKLLQAMPHNPLTDVQRSQVIPLLTSTVHQAIHSYNLHAAITPLCPASVPTAPINDGSTGTHSHLLAVTQTATGSSLLYALGQDGRVYQLKQLNGLNSLANPITSNLQALDIAGDDARLAILTKGNTTNNYFLYLLVSGKTGQPQATDIANISAVNGESPTLMTAQGSDVYVVLTSPPSATPPHAQIVDFTVGSNNMLNPNPTRTSFTLAGSVVSAAAFPNHMLFLLLANGSLVSLQVGSSNATLSPVLVPAPFASPLAGSGTAFTATMPVPTPANSAAVTSAGPVPLQVASTADLAAESLSAAVVGGVPHLYLADTANRRVVDLSGSTNVLVPLAGTRSASKSQLFQMVQQYASSSILGQMKGIAMDAKGMVLYALTQSNPPLVRLVSIAMNESGRSSPIYRGNCE